MFAGAAAGAIVVPKVAPVSYFFAPRGGWSCDPRAGYFASMASVYSGNAHRLIIERYLFGKREGIIMTDIIIPEIELSGLFGAYQGDGGQYYQGSDKVLAPTFLGRAGLLKD